MESNLPPYCVILLFLLLVAEQPHYEPAGEEIVVPDMHTRKKMMFDKVKLSWWLMYHSVPQIRPPPPPSRISPPPCIFSTNFCWGIFSSCISPPRPRKDSPRCRNIEIYLPKPLGCLPLKCLLRTRTAHINDGHTSFFAEAPCFLTPQRWSSLAYC